MPAPCSQPLNYVCVTPCTFISSTGAGIANHKRRCLHAQETPLASEDTEKQIDVKDQSQPPQVSPNLGTDAADCNEGAAASHDETTNNPNSVASTFTETSDSAKDDLIEKLKADIERLEEDKRSLQSSLAANQDEYAAADKNWKVKHGFLIKSNTNLSNDIESLRAKHSNAVRRSLALAEEHAKQVAELQKESTQRSKRIRTLKDGMASLEKAKADVEEKLAEESQKLQQLSSAWKTAKSRILALTDELEQGHAQVALDVHLDWLETSRRLQALSNHKGRESDDDNDAEEFWELFGELQMFVQETSNAYADVLIEKRRQSNASGAKPYRLSMGSSRASSLGDSRKRKRSDATN